MQKCKEVCMENEMVNFSSEIINESCENIFIVDELNVAESSAVATNIEIHNDVLLNAEEEEEDVDERAIMNAQCQGIVEEIVASVEGGYNLEIPSESELVIENRWIVQPMLQSAHSRSLPTLGWPYVGSLLYRKPHWTISTSSFLNWVSFFHNYPPS
ncbi:hypothetical protein C0J52_17177 [Blattella germanica]|nr:hypothetical protein C0J52_17177 [Blattella germanica]